jgi:hypothetical protein
MFKNLAKKALAVAAVSAFALGATLAATTAPAQAGCGVHHDMRCR